MRSRTLSPQSQIALFLAFLLAATPLLSQQPAPTQPPGESPGPLRRIAPGGLHILVLEGQGVANSVSTTSAISPVVQVLDSMDQPVQGATVVFEVAPVGPGGTFANEFTATVKSDFNGQATALFKPNKTPGAFTIKVTASYFGQTATIPIRQVNDRRLTEAMVPLPPKPWFKNWKWWAAIGAGAGAGIATATILSNRSGTPTITLSPGPVVIGGPR